MREKGRTVHDKNGPLAKGSTHHPSGARRGTAHDSEMATLVEPHSMIDPLYGSYYNYSSANVSLSGTPAAADGPMSHMAYGCQCCSCQSHHFELRKSSIVEHVQKMNYLYHHHQQQQQQHYHYHHHLQQQKYRHYLRPSPAQNIESSSSLIARKREHASITDAKKVSCRRENANG